MRKIIVSEFISLDGVIEDPGGSEKSKHGAWTFLYWTDDIGKYKAEELFACDAQLLGRVTYQGFAAAWPTMEGTGEFGEKMKNMPKYVVSTTLDKVEWNNSHLIKRDVVSEIGKLKQQPGGDILIGGSARLINSLIPHNLIDEYRLLVYPIVLGSGKRLFHDDNMVKLTLIESKPFNSGVVALTYRLAQDK
jgi:dihydrofolate reductase